MATLGLKQALNRLFEAQRQRSLFLLKKEEDEYVAYLSDMAQESAKYESIFSGEIHRNTRVLIEETTIREQILKEFQYWFARFVHLLSCMGHTEQELIEQLQERTHRTLEWSQ